MLMWHASLYPQPEQAEQAGERVVDGPSGRALGVERGQLHSVKPEGGRLRVDLGAPVVLGRGVLDDPVDGSEAVDAGDRRQAPADRGRGEAGVLLHACPQLEVAAAHREHVEGAPGTRRTST
jgi:hypothetical protein